MPAASSDVQSRSHWLYAQKLDPDVRKEIIMRRSRDRIACATVLNVIAASLVFIGKHLVSDEPIEAVIPGAVISLVPIALAFYTWAYLVAHKPRAVVLKLKDGRRILTMPRLHLFCDFGG